MNTTSTFSTRFLVLSFIIALPIFILIRWDSSTWLTKQVNQAATNAGYTLQYNQVSLSGLGISFDNLQIDKPNMNSLKFSSLDASLSLSNLFSGLMAADIHALWNASPIALTAAMDGNLIRLSNISADVDLKQLENTLLKMPVKLSGNVHAEGSISFDAQTNQPRTGEIDVAWNQAMAGLAQPEFDLGDYKLHLASAEDTTQPWVWNLSGGTGVALNGTGTINTQNPNPQHWNINGNVSIHADDSNPSLGMMVQAVSGSSQANVRLSGTFARPKTEIIR